MITVTDISFPSTHPALAGHFPGMPIVPGVVLLDAILSAIATYCQVRCDRCTLIAVKFRGVMQPDQRATLRLECSAADCVRFELESANQAVVTGAIRFAVARKTDGH
jgi:3-hydroxyacyl-[acyl-carrier-protein] dehydratase